MINRKYHFPHIPPVEPVRHVVYQRSANDRKQEFRLRATERPKPRRKPSGENQSFQRLFQSLSSRIHGGTVVIAFTRERADEFLSPSSSWKRLGQKGVDAIFTSAREHRPHGLLVGVLALFAFIQSSVIAALYAGLVEEYQSNLSMQQLVRLAFPTAKYILNWETVLVLSTLLGLITTQFLPGRILAERKTAI